MRTSQPQHRSLRVFLGASILAVALAAVPLAAQAEEPAPVTPVITSAPLPAGTVGVPYEYQLTSNVAPVTFDVSGLPDGLESDPVTGVISGTPATAGESTVRLEAIAESGGEFTYQRYDTLVIAPAPVTVPVITSPTPPRGTVGVAYSFQVTSNVTPVTFSITGLPDGLAADEQTGLITGTPTAEGEFTVRLEAIGAEPTGDVSMVVYATVIIEPAPVTLPVITSGPMPSGTVGVPYSFQFTSNVSPVTFAVSGLPAGLTADAQSGLVSGIPTTEGEYEVTLEVVGDPPSGGTAMIVYQTVIASTTTPAPVFIPSTPPPAVAGAPYRFQLDAVGEELTFSATGLPDGLVADPQTGLVTGTPTTAGTYHVTFRIVDSLGRTATQEQDLRVDPAPLAAPVITSGPLPDGTAGTPYLFQVQSSALPATFAATGLPHGISINPTTGLISGTTSDDGPYVVTLTVAAGGLTSAPVEYRMTINPRVIPPVSPPVFTSTPPSSAQVGVDFSYRPVITTNSRTTFSLTGAVPGLTVDPTTGTLSGTPTTAGTYSLTITATNGAPTTASQTFTLTVAPVTPPPTSTPSAPATEAPQPAAPGVPQGPVAASTQERAGSPSQLANTGAPAPDVLPAAITAALLLAAGIAFAMRRRRADKPAQS
jgi:hypothetical protein